MLNIKDIEELFKNELYDKAIIEIKKELRLDSFNAELFYYLFLAENGDYLNINLDDINNEIDLNKAISLANIRLKASFESEYNFYQAVDSTYRKLFIHATRDRMKEFIDLCRSINLSDRINLVNDKSDEREFISNLDYIVTSRVNHEVVDMNLIALNLFYLNTRRNEVLKIYDVLKLRAIDMNTPLSKSNFINDYNDLEKSIILLTGQKEELLKDEYIKESEPIIDSNEPIIDNNIGDIKIDPNDDIRSYKDDAYISSGIKNNRYNANNKQKKSSGYDGCGRVGKVLSLISGIFSIIWSLISLVCILSGLRSFPYVPLMSILVTLSIVGLVLGKIARNSNNATNNGSIAAVGWGIAGIMIFVFGMFIYLVLIRVVGYYY